MRLREPSNTIALGPAARPLAGACAAVGAAALAGAAALGLARDDHGRYFFHAYLTSYCFWLSISLGGLFFVAVQHAVKAGWSVTVRRVAELLGANFLVLAVLMLPIAGCALWWQHALYAWADPSHVQYDGLLRHKQAYLNPASFTIRAALYLAIWWGLGRYFLQNSLCQDESSDAAPTRRMEWLSPLALLLFAFTLTFAAIDWLMSLTPHWYSTIYGVYFFSGAVVGGLAAMVLLLMGLQAAGRLRQEVSVEHYHDLGKLLFAFVVFWGYIAFSQYLLVWYANIPEETTWYRPRHSGPWGWLSIVLLFGHLLLPFFGLLSRHAKRNKLALGFWAAWLLAMHWIDLYWLVMPQLDPRGLPFGPIDVCCLLGIGGAFLAGLLVLCGNRPLLPLGDPRLAESLKFENV